LQTNDSGVKFPRTVADANECVAQREFGPSGGDYWLSANRSVASVPVRGASRCC
jgi:hypothetical protein